MKYELLDEVFVYGDKQLKQIKALKDFGDVKKGDLGGFVENNLNLDQEGECWIDPSVILLDSSHVTGSVQIKGDVIVKDNAIIKNDFYNDDRNSNERSLIIENKTQTQLINGKEKDEKETILISGNSKILGYGEIVLQQERKIDDYDEEYIEPRMILKDVFAIGELNINTNQEVRVFESTLSNLEIKEKAIISNSTLDNSVVKNVNVVRSYISNANILNDNHINNNISFSSIHLCQMENVNTILNTTICEKAEFKNMDLLGHKSDYGEESYMKYLMFDPIANLKALDYQKALVNIEIDENQLDNPKYVLREDNNYKDMYKIVALKDFGVIKKGDVGGLVSGYHNLSQRGYCWIGNDCIVSDNAKIIENAVVAKNSFVRENAIVKGDAFIANDSVVKGSAIVQGDANVKQSEVRDYAIVNLYSLNNCSVDDDVVLNGFVSIENSVLSQHVGVTSLSTGIIKNSHLDGLISLNGRFGVTNTRLSEFCLLDGAFNIKDSLLCNSINLKMLNINIKGLEATNNGFIYRYEHPTLDIYSYKDKDGEECLSITSKKDAMTARMLHVETYFTKKDLLENKDNCMANFVTNLKINENEYQRIVLKDIIQNVEDFFNGKVLDKQSLEPSMNKDVENANLIRFKEKHGLIESLQKKNKMKLS